MVFIRKIKISKSVFLLSICFSFLLPGFAQDSYEDLKMTSEYVGDNLELGDILQFQGIEYMKLKFSGEELKDKRYQLRVKEFWNGKLVADSVFFNSADIGIEAFEKVNDSILSMKVIATHTHENKLKLQFRFSRFSILKTYDAIDSDDYSLRNIAEESRMPIGYGKDFYLLAYILPYEREDGSKSWCDVGSSGKDIENWGKKFGIEHYVLFEMKFD